MSSSRMGYDLTQKVGWKNLRYAIKWKHMSGPKQYLLADTFGQFKCWFVGHDIYDAGDSPDRNEPACKRCHHYL